MQSLRGTFTALVTPFRDGQVDLPALEKLVNRQVVAGMDGLVPCGTTGEAPTLSMDEYREVVGCVRRTAPKHVPVFAGAGSNSTAHTLELSQVAAACGVDGLLIVTPYYNKPSAEGLYQHFATIADAVDLPIMLYNIPGRTGVTLTNDTILRLREKSDRIAAVKHATGQILDAAELLSRTDLPLLSGDDPLTLPLISVGAVGTVSVTSNLMPELVVRMVSAALAGDLTGARTAYRELFPVAQVLMTLDSNPVPLKAALAQCDLCHEDVRLPLTPLSADKRSILEKSLAAIGR
jgi:4-hydroxy-tetrahydrodipicolinate synthase